MNEVSGTCSVSPKLKQAIRIITRRAFHTVCMLGHVHRGRTSPPPRRVDESSQDRERKDVWVTGAPLDSPEKTGEMAGQPPSTEYRVQYQLDAKGQGAPRVETRLVRLGSEKRHWVDHMFRVRLRLVGTRVRWYIRLPNCASQRFRPCYRKTNEGSNHCFHSRLSPRHVLVVVVVVQDGPLSDGEIERRDPPILVGQSINKAIARLTGHYGTHRKCPLRSRNRDASGVWCL